MCIVEVMAAGPEAVAKRTAVMGEFATLIEENAASELDSHGSVPQMHAQTIVAGAYEAVYRMIAAGETDKLSTLLPDLVESALLPYIGEEQAAAQKRAILEADASAGSGDPGRRPGAGGLDVAGLRPRRRTALAGLAGAAGLALIGTGPATAATTVDFTGSVGPAIRVVPKKPLPVSLGIKLGITSDQPGELPATLDRTTISFPYGSQLNSRLFPSCSADALNRRGLRACPKASRIGSGFAVGVGDTVRQRLTATLFNGPGGRRSPST